MNFLPLILESLTFICGLLCYKYISPRFLKIFMLLLTLTVINEVTVVPYLVGYNPRAINIVYNVYSFIDMAVWFVFFYHLFPQKSVRTVLIAAAVICFTYSIIELTVLHTWYRMHYDSFRLYGLIILFFSLRYLYLLTKKEIHHLETDPFFWLCAGAVCFHSIFFVNLTTIAEHNYWQLKNAASVFVFFNNVANILYYGCICMCFITCYIKHKRVPRPIY